MAEILLGSHVGMSGKEMFLGSVKEAESYGANALMVYTGAPQNTRRKDVSELRLSEGLAYAKECGVKSAILKAKSPSCGCGRIYNGCFRGELRPGYGVTAALLERNGIHVQKEE